MPARNVLQNANSKTSHLHKNQNIYDTMLRVLNTIYMTGYKIMMTSLSFKNQNKGINFMILQKLAYSNSIIKIYVNICIRNHPVPILDQNLSAFYTCVN